MKKLAYLILGVFLLFTAITTFVDINVYGVANSKDVLEAINKHEKDTIFLEGSFLRIGNMPTIYKTSSTLLFKYTIIDVGGVYRWSEASHKIDSIYNTFEKTDRQKI